MRMISKTPRERFRAAALILIALVAWGLASSAVGADKPLNVVVILADDLGYGDLGVYGHPKFKTPNIDRMAGEGARLTQFNTTCPFCAPTRAALMTGRYQFRSGITGNPTPDAGINHIGIPDTEITLGQAFQKAGYATACVGKWHLGHLPQFFPTRHGFDEYLGILYSNDMRPVNLVEGEKVVEYPVVQSLLMKKYTARCEEFIEKNKDKPFFLYFPGVMPHKPLTASEDFYKKSGAGLYGDAMAELDWSVGRILAKLKELGLDERTLVIFTSDNGPWYGGSTGGLRGMKGLSFEGGMRVPMIARLPGKIPAGHVSKEVASMIDIFPTVLRAAGVPLPKYRIIDGRDIMPLLTSNAKSPHEAIFCLQTFQLNAVRSGPWKLHIVPPNPARTLKPDEKWVDPRGPDGVTIIAPYEQTHPSQYPGVLTGDEVKRGSLFNLETDPAEQHDVAAQNPEVVQRLTALYEEMNKQVPAQKPVPKKKK